MSRWRRSNGIAGIASATLVTLALGIWLTNHPGSQPALSKRADRAPLEGPSTGAVSTLVPVRADTVEVESSVAFSSSGQDPTEPAIRVWSDEPAIVERKIYDWLALMGDWQISSINSVSCTSRRCNVRISGTGDYFNRQFQTGLFAAIRPQVIGTRRYEVAPGVFEYSITAHSFRDDNFEPTESDLKHLVTAPITARDYDRPPAPLGQYEGIELVLETFCAGTCPLETRRVVRIDVPEDETCEGIGGVERLEVVPAEVGYRDQRFCIPAFLAQN